MFGSDTAKLSKGEGSSMNVTTVGVIPQSLRDLYQLVEDQRQVAALGEAWSITLGFFEVYNDQVYDLIESTGKNLPVREDADRGVVCVVGLKETMVHSPDEIIDLINRGQKLRKMEPTMANVVSSRSHAVIQVSVKHVTRNAKGFETMVESKLSLIDLAGSERASATNNRGLRLQEGANINKSLLALANCINALSENAVGGKKANVKYRDSKLTHILRTSLEGNCNLVMISNINPSDGTYEDSLHTLQYANRAKNIKVSPTAREVIVESTSLEREAHLREDNEQLRQAMQDMEAEMAQMRLDNEQLQLELNNALESIATINNKRNSSSTLRRLTFGFGRASTSSNNNSSSSNTGTSPPRGQTIGRSSTTPHSPAETSKIGSSCPSPTSRQGSISPKSIRDPASPESPVDTVPEEDEHIATAKDIDIDIDSDNEKDLEVAAIDHTNNSLDSTPKRPNDLRIESKSAAAKPRKRGFWSLFICGATSNAVQS
jgi:hypothetical protein